ncbi:MAG: PRC-barrel domain-containing protein [Leptospiraceae bacterium]|nr:PRC-barrel domain-containing protein [Leptospiraceae bacterium]MDW7975718.1 PRC-barrel domain-containing protein [Leptospiraceae bacterium]
MSKIGLESLIPIGFIQDFFVNKNELIVSTKGDSLQEIEIPFDAFVVQLLGKGRNFKTKQEKKNIQYDVSSEGFIRTSQLLKYRIFKIRILERVIRKKRMGLFIEFYEPLPDTIIGSWVCIPIQVLEQKDELYFFKIKNKEVYDTKGNLIGNVFDYMETSAHGILEIRLIPQLKKKNILVPFVDEFCQIVFHEDTKGVSKIIIKDWEYFLET